MRIIRCVLSGSYRKDVVSLKQDYRELVTNGCQVLSPHKLDFLDTKVAFVKDSAEATMSPHDIEQHHLMAIRQSDFVWLHCPRGYLGISASLEVGYALALGVPIFCKVRPQELVFEQLVQVVPSVFMALEVLKNGQKT